VNCKYCFRPMTKEILAEKRRRKILNALASTKKRIASGNKCGPKRIIDSDQIEMLRAKGLSMRAIAKETGVSATTVNKRLHGN
jgi:DNA invertase Pin-like site-specific DNA recombinase